MQPCQKNRYLFLHTLRDVQHLRDGMKRNAAEVGCEAKALVVAAKPDHTPTTFKKSLRGSCCCGIRCKVNQNHPVNSNVWQLNSLGYGSRHGKLKSAA